MQCGNWNWHPDLSIVVVSNVLYNWPGILTASVFSICGFCSKLLTTWWLRAKQKSLCACSFEAKGLCQLRGEWGQDPKEEDSKEEFVFSVDCWHSAFDRVMPVSRQCPWIFSYTHMVFTSQQNPSLLLFWRDSRLHWLPGHTHIIHGNLLNQEPEHNHIYIVFFPKSFLSVMSYRRAYSLSFSLQTALGSAYPPRPRALEKI